MNIEETRDQMSKALDRSIALLLAFASLDISKMSLRDQFSIPVIFMDIADMVEPYVKKYGGSVEEITAKYEKQQAENQMKDYLASMVIKNIKNGPKEKKDEQDS